MGSYTDPPRLRRTWPAVSSSAIALASGSDRASRSSLVGDQRVAFAASGQGPAKTRPLPVGASQPVVDVDPVARHPECDKAIALGSQVLLIGGSIGHTR